MKQISKVGKVFLKQIIRKQIVDRSRDNIENVNNGSITGGRSKCESIGTRLSRLQIQTAIYLHSLDIDSNGIIRRVYFKDAAKALNCSEKSVKNNIAILHRRYIIDYTPINHNFCSVLLPMYSKYHLEGCKGGEGYIDIPAVLMKELLECKTVNEIRLSICQLLNLDKQRLKQEKESDKTISEVCHKREITTIVKIDDYKYGMPNYLNSASKIKELVDKIKFTQIEYLENRKIKVSLNNEFDYSEYRNRLMIEYENKLKSDLELFTTTFNEKHMYDLIQMCIQYSYEEVLDALAVFDSERFNSKYSLTDKYCGYIRNIIKKSRFLKERAA